jgi:hypothetical protein
MLGPEHDEYQARVNEVLAESERNEAWAEIEAALATFEGPDGFIGPCELVVAAGIK